MVPEVDLAVLVVICDEGRGGRYVAAADADVGYADENIVGIDEFGYLFVFEFGVLGAVEDY